VIDNVRSIVVPERKAASQRRQPPTLRVRIVGRNCFFTASAEEAARPVIVIREAVAIAFIHACIGTVLLGVDLGLPNPPLALVNVAFQLIQCVSFKILRQNAFSKLRGPAHRFPVAAPLLSSLMEGVE